MAVTNYVSAGGMLIGEVTNGVMRNYGTDALGSVVKTAINGVEENSYTYKPYGGTLAKIGAASDPSFLWNGGSGYRATILSCSSHYVRNRHYSDSVGSWTTADPLWPREAPYAYAKSSPLFLADPTGLSTCKITDYYALDPQPKCTASIENGMLYLAAAKPMKFYCTAQCHGGPSACSIYQEKYGYVEVWRGANILILNSTNGQWVSDPPPGGDPVQCDSNYIPAPDWTSGTWYVQGADAPGISGAYRTNCDLHNLDVKVPTLQMVDPKVKKTIFGYMMFKTYCSCCQFNFTDMFTSEELNWSFVWSVSFVGTDLNNTITFGGDCAGS